MRNLHRHPRLSNVFFVRSYPMSGERKPAPCPLEGEGWGGGYPGTNFWPRPDRVAQTTEAAAVFLHGRTPCPVRNKRLRQGQSPIVIAVWNLRISNTEGTENHEGPRRFVGGTAGGEASRLRAPSWFSVSSVLKSFFLAAAPADGFSPQRDPMPGDITTASGGGRGPAAPAWGVSTPHPNPPPQGGRGRDGGSHRRERPHVR